MISNKKFRKEFLKERKENPELPDKAIRQIVFNHLKEKKDKKEFNINQVTFDIFPDENKIIIGNMKKMKEFKL